MSNRPAARGCARAWVCSLACALFALAWSPAAKCDEVNGNLDFFFPSPHSSDFLTIYTGETRGIGMLSLGLMADYEQPSLSVYQKDSDKPCCNKYVTRRATGDLFVNLGFTPYLEIGVVVPIVFHNYGSDPELGMNLDSFGIGDIRLHFKQILSGYSPSIEKQKAHRLAIAGYVSLPSGREESLFGSRIGTIAPSLVAQTGGGLFRIAMNLGFVFRLAENFGPVDVGQELTFGLTSWVHFAKSKVATFVAEIRGATQLSSDFFDQDASPVEIDGAFVFNIKDFRVTIGAGTGLTGYSVPEWRAFLGLSWVWSKPVGDRVPDRDRDGVRDSMDRCPFNKDIL